MKIGLLLGSFNPVTIAHVAMASNVIASGLCDKVLFVVAKHNPWKKEAPAPFELRCQMIEEAIRPLGETCEVCRFEEKHEAPVYSYIPINEAIEAYPNDEIILIAGTDTIDRIPRWKNFETHIKDKIGFIMVTRFYEGHQHSNLVGIPIPFRVGYEAVCTNMKAATLEIQRLDISSTMVRNMVSKGMNPYPYVTEGVAKIISDNKLYM
jgi:nicotinate-nucleotide adenylyltransferase